MNDTYPIAYAAYNKNLDIRLKSTSGGIFTVLAEYFINNYQAAVYGAAFDTEFEVRHIRVDNINDLEKLRGSKYPQSHVGYTFKFVKKDLEEGKTVFFIGTPCQILALKNFLKKDYDNLYTMDFVCHGVASDSVWRAYVNLLEKKHGEIQSIVFKKKLKGWKKWYFNVDYKDGSHWSKRGYLTWFMNSYLTYTNIRPSCYECTFKGLKRASDFTISDCWGIGEQDNTMNDNKGLSALLIQNERAKNIFNEISKNIRYKEYDAFKLMEGNWTTFKPVPVNPIRKEFFDCVEKESAEVALEKYFKPSIRMMSRYYLLRLRGKEK